MEAETIRPPEIFTCLMFNFQGLVTDWRYVCDAESQVFCWIRLLVNIPNSWINNGAVAIQGTDQSYC